MDIKWVALAYNIPGGSSKSRVYVWRKLRDMGAKYFKSGVAILPQTGENIQRFRQLLRSIEEAGGSGTLVELRFLEEQAEQRMVQQFDEQARSGYGRVIAHGLELFRPERPAPAGQKELRRLERELRQAHENDYFGSGLTGELRRGLDLLMRSAGESIHAFEDTLREILDK